MFLVNVFIIIALFLLAVSMPITSFLLPVFKIKKISSLNMKQQIIVNLLAIAAIGFFDKTFLVIYVGFFLLSEGLYYFFKRAKKEIAIFDRIFVTSILVTAVMSIFALTVKSEILTVAEMIKAMYIQKVGINAREAEEIFNFIKNNSLFLLFVYSGVSTYLSYYFLERKSYFNWEVSYKWVIPYIVTFFTINIFKINNFYVNNILEITKVMYILFGIKVMSSFIGKRIEIKGVPKILSLALAFNFPTAAFILGVIKSFNFKMKVKVIKK